MSLAAKERKAPTANHLKFKKGDRVTTNNGHCGEILTGFDPDLSGGCFVVHMDAPFECAVHDDCIFRAVFHAMFLTLIP